MVQKQQKTMLIQENKFFSLPRPKYLPALDKTLQLPAPAPPVKRRNEILKKKSYVGSRRFTVDVASNDYIQALISANLHKTAANNNNLKVASKSINDLNKYTIDSNKVLLDSKNNLNNIVEEDLKLNTLPNMKIKCPQKGNDDNDNYLIRAKGPEFIVQSNLGAKTLDVCEPKVSI